MKGRVLRLRMNRRMMMMEGMSVLMLLHLKLLLLLQLQLVVQVYRVERHWRLNWRQGKDRLLLLLKLRPGKAERAHAQPARARGRSVQQQLLPVARVRPA